MAIFTKGVVREFANRIGTDAEHMANVPGIKPTMPIRLTHTNAETHHL